MGMYALQQARIDHPKTFIIALASQRHHDMLRKFGADQVFDYSSTSVVDEVRKLGRDVRRAIDCHSEGRSTVIAAECMLPDDGPETCPAKDRRRLIRSLPPSMISGTVPQSVRADEWILSYTALGKVSFLFTRVGRLISCLLNKQPFWFLFKHYPAMPEDYNSASTYLKNLTCLLEEGKVVPVPHRIMPGGLGDIGKGFEEIRAGRVRGEKLVYRVAGEVGVA